MMPSTRKGVQILAALSLAEGLAAFVWLMSLPTNRQVISLSRLAGLVVILLVVFASAAVLIYSRTQNSTISQIIEKIENFKNRILLSFLLVSVSLLLWAAIPFKGQWLVFVPESTYLRLLPIILYALLLCLQVGVFLLFIRRGTSSAARDPRFIWKPAFVLWAIFLASLLFITFSRLGFLHDEVGLSWGPPGTPISFAQVQLVLAVSVILVFGWYIAESGLRKALFFQYLKRDLLVFLGLWGMAVILWSNEPMSPTHFSPPPMPPNEEVYPNSDALIFDRSSYHLLYGMGFSNQLTRRPLYVGMLALFHKIAGGNYEKTVFLQILVLALIPPLVYLFTSILSNRMAGLIAGGLILLREKNSIELSGEIVTSHAKLMMSDMIAMLGVLLFLYVTVKFLFRKNPSHWEPAIAGACLGLTALIRAQVLILAAPLLLFILLSKKPFKLAVRASLFALLGMVLVMSPWLGRNWNLTGTFVLDDRGEERLLARNYSLTPLSLPSPLAGETEKEFSDRLKSDVLTFIRTHPREVLFFVSNHFFRNMATSSVYLAPTYSTDSPSNLVARLPFWNDWTGDLPSGSSIFLFINLAILAFGIGIAMAKNKYAGLFPFVVFLTYGFGNALVRSSGWRFIQPADWISLVYFSIALAYLPSKIRSAIQGEVSDPAIDERMSSGRMSVPQPVIFLLLLLLGASIPIAERLIPPRNYQGLSERAAGVLSQEQYLALAEMDAFLAQKEAVFLSGVTLYPRYIRPNSRIYLADAPVGYRYLHFWLMTEEDDQIVLPLQNVPGNIPHTATVSVLGCREDRYISAFAVIVHEPSSHILIRSPGAPLQCPVTEPPQEK